MALALIGSALALRSLETLHLAKAELDRDSQAYAADGAQLEAAADIIRSGLPGRFAWSFSTESGWVQALAEPESEKLSLQAASGLDDATLGRFGVADPAVLRARLAQAATLTSQVDVGSLDAASTWRDCGPSFVSQFGRQTQFKYSTPQQPTVGTAPAAWHIAEEWRIRVATSAGWRDDRIIRFTGNAAHPAAVVKRSFTKGEGDECEVLLAGLAGG